MTFTHHIEHKTVCTFYFLLHNMKELDLMVIVVLYQVHLSSLKVYSMTFYLNRSVPFIKMSVNKQNILLTFVKSQTLYAYQEIKDVKRSTVLRAPSMRRNQRPLMKKDLKHVVLHEVHRYPSLGQIK